MDSILVSHPVAIGSIFGIPKFLTEYNIVAIINSHLEQWIKALKHLVLASGMLVILKLHFEIVKINQRGLRCLHMPTEKILL